jgi:hypothetical protein
MRVLLVLIAVIAGLAGGIALAAFAIGPGSSILANRIGAWEFSPRVGAPNIDPYARARLFTEGELPLAAGEGYALRASRDRNGEVLDGGCRYRVSSPVPNARFWSITLVDPSGRLIPNLAERHSFTSGEIVRSGSGQFAVEIGPEPVPGNWLPTNGRMGRFIIIFRFYETPLSAPATTLEPEGLPRIELIGCSA